MNKKPTQLHRIVLPHHRVSPVATRKPHTYLINNKSINITNIIVLSYHIGPFYYNEAVAALRLKQ